MKSINRREYFKISLAGSALLAIPPILNSCKVSQNKIVLNSPLVSAQNGGCLISSLSPINQTISADIVIAGGSTGGCAAALAAARMGQRVILVEETDWIGGQLTSQGVPPDENPWIETTGCTHLYRTYRNNVREYYKQHFPLSNKALNAKYLDPGNGGVSPLCHDPRVAVSVLNQMLAPYIISGKIMLFLNHQIIDVVVNEDKIESFIFKNSKSGNTLTAKAPYFIDATELGDVLPLGNIEYVTGAESRSETGEPHAVEGPAQPLNMQAISHCFALSYYPGENHIIEKPRDYDFWRDYQPQMTPPWPGKQLAWCLSDAVTLAPRETSVFQKRENGTIGGLFYFRRIADMKNFEPGFLDSDVTLVNWPMMDYWLKPIIGLSPEDTAVAIEEARQLSLSLIYWMQTECPRHDGKGKGYPGLKLRKDVFGTENGLAKYPYIRESRRIKAEFTILEQHVASELDPRENFATPFRDSCGIGWYRIDLHPSTGGNNYIDIGALPFQIPLGALIPKR
ncbi:MAG TPA: FAD-dependent oxidoreductase, partial [Draconibacterium sp.]|nr:FAD-dependent oxidoreductase [Draconibacterium sp.]